jgi:hypothetical protein
LWRTGAAHAASLRRLLEALNGELRRQITMSGLEFPRDMNPLSDQVDACCERVLLSSSVQSKWVLQSWNVEFQQSLTLGQCPVRFHEDLGCRKSSVIDGLRNLRRIKRLSGLRENLCLTFHQIYIGMINAIQALQGFLRPFRSKASYHAVDFYGGLVHLRWSRDGEQKATEG